LTYDPHLELDLDMAKMNQRAEYLGQGTFHLKVIVQTHTDMPDQMLYMSH